MLLTKDAAGLLADLDKGALAVPDGLAIKMYPCYALRRPIAAVGSVRSGRHRRHRADRRARPRAVAPLHHHRPATGLQGKSSLEYGVAAALLDDHPGFASFTDAAVRRAEAQRLVRLVEVELAGGGDGLLDGSTAIEAHRRGATPLRTDLDLPPGAPARPPTPNRLRRKVADCLVGTTIDSDALTWARGDDLLREVLGAPDGFRRSASSTPAPA